jgi:DNA-binding MarR family transcriptional regulator
LSLTRSELRSWVRIVAGMQALLDALDRQLRDEAGMSHEEYRILSRLHRAGDQAMRMSDLAQEVGFSPSRLSHSATHLESEGWLRRQRSHDDGRVVIAALTIEGRAKVEAVSPGHLRLVDQLVFETLGSERATETAEAFDQIRRATL